MANKTFNNRTKGRKVHTRQLEQVMPPAGGLQRSCVHHECGRGSMGQGLGL